VNQGQRGGSRAPVSLRGLSLALALMLGGLGIVGAVSLVAVTTFLHRTALALGATAEGMRLAEEVQVELLSVARLRNLRMIAPSPHVGEALVEAEAELQDLLTGFPRSETLGEAAEFQTVREKVREYLAARKRIERSTSSLTEIIAQTGPQLEEAIAAAQDLVDTNLAQHDRAQAEAARWDRIANVVGVVVAVVLLLGIAAVLITLRRLVLEPIATIGRAMARFGAGERAARAPERGPRELRRVAQQFNEMAVGLARQQESQLAFIAGVSHDLRNPLSALKTSTAILAPGRPLPPEERLRSLLDLSRRQIDKLERMVNDLLDAARIEAGHLELRPEEHDLRDVVRAAYDLYENASEAHPISLDMPPSPVRVRCDALRIEQVLHNLLSNAIKYSPAGGAVELSLAAARHEAVVSVRDRGLGISAEEQERIFEPFRRTRSAQTAARGAGLGLAVARRIVEAHAGRIDVESVPGKGSTFRVRLPLLGDDGVE